MKRVLACLGAVILVGSYVLCTIETPGRTPTEEGQAPDIEGNRHMGEVPTGDGAGKQRELAGQNEVETSSANAPSASSPILTIEGAIQDIVTSMKIDDEEKARRRAYLEASDVEAKAVYNPQKKVLNPEQRLRLQSLLKSLGDQTINERIAYQREMAQGYVDAISKGNYITREYGLAVEGSPYDVGQRMNAFKADREAMISHLRSRLGPDDGWIWMQTSTSAPDGVRRQSVLFITRRENPLLFSKQDAVSRSVRNQMNSIREFFSHL